MKDVDRIRMRGANHFNTKDMERAFALNNSDQGRIYAIFYGIVLDELKLAGRIIGYSETEKDSPADQRGIDFWIRALDGRFIPVSITSTREYMERRKRQHPEIPCIFIRQGKKEKRTRTVEDLISVTISLISEYQKA